MKKPKVIRAWVPVDEDKILEPMDLIYTTRQEGLDDGFCLHELVQVEIRPLKPTRKGLRRK